MSAIKRQVVFAISFNPVILTKHDRRRREGERLRRSPDHARSPDLFLTPVILTESDRTKEGGRVEGSRRSVQCHATSGNSHDKPFLSTNPISPSKKSWSAGALACETNHGAHAVSSNYWECNFSATHLDPVILTEHDRRRSKGEWKDPDALSSAMPHQGILTTSLFYPQIRFLPLSNRGAQAPSPAVQITPFRSTSTVLPDQRSSA
jgi:hypothetical protein